MKTAQEICYNPYQVTMGLEVIEALRVLCLFPSHRQPINRNR